MLYALRSLHDAKVLQNPVRKYVASLQKHAERYTGFSTFHVAAADCKTIVDD